MHFWNKIYIRRFFLSIYHPQHISHSFYSHLYSSEYFYISTAMGFSNKKYWGFKYLEAVLVGFKGIRKIFLKFLEVFKNNFRKSKILTNFLFCYLSALSSCNIKIVWRAIKIIINIFRINRNYVMWSQSTITN